VQWAVTWFRSNQPGSGRAGNVHAVHMQCLFEAGAANLRKCRFRGTYFSMRCIRCRCATAPCSAIITRLTALRIKDGRSSARHHRVGSRSAPGCRPRGEGHVSTDQTPVLSTRVRLGLGRKRRGPASTLALATLAIFPHRSTWGLFGGFAAVSPLAYRSSCSLPSCMNS
jgi:hypothetical protein